MSMSALPQEALSWIKVHLHYLLLEAHLLCGFALGCHTYLCVYTVRSEKLPTDFFLIGMNYRKSYRYQYRSVINSELIKVTDTYSYRP